MSLTSDRAKTLRRNAQQKLAYRSVSRVNPETIEVECDFAT